MNAALVPRDGGESGPEYGLTCFLCLRPFGDGVEATMEDVVPKWLMKFLDLSRRAADLPGGQMFGYPKRKVPCCLDCNGRMSAHLEGPVSAAFRAGYDAVCAVDPRLLLMWLAKVYYGTRYRETALRTDVADQGSPLMLELGDLLSRIEYMRRLLLLNPESLQFTAPPASLFIYKAGTPDALQDRFDFFVPTFPGSDFIALRIADTFVMCVFGDNGHWVSQLGDIRLVAAAHDLVLHPAQCVDLMMWFVSEVAGHDSYGCYDMIVVNEPTRPGLTLFMPQFRVEPNDLDRRELSRSRAQSLLWRLGGRRMVTSDVVDKAGDGGFPSTLVNANTDELVQATCFEMNCPGVLLAAGWQVSGPSCARCGAGLT